MGSRLENPLVYNVLRWVATPIHPFGKGVDRLWGWVVVPGQLMVT